MMAEKHFLLPRWREDSTGEGWWGGEGQDGVEGTQCLTGPGTTNYQIQES